MNTYELVIKNTLTQEVVEVQTLERFSLERAMEILQEEARSQSDLEAFILFDGEGRWLAVISEGVFIKR